MDSNRPVFLCLADSTMINVLRIDRIEPLVYRLAKVKEIVRYRLVTHNGGQVKKVSDTPFPESDFDPTEYYQDVYHKELIDRDAYWDTPESGESATHSRIIAGDYQTIVNGPPAAVRAQIFAT